MVNANISAGRILFDEGFELYPDQYVLLGYVEEEEGNVISGVPVAVANREDRNDMWKLFLKCFMEKTHGDVDLNYFGDVESSGVYL